MMRTCKRFLHVAALLLCLPCVAADFDVDVDTGGELFVTKVPIVASSDGYTIDTTIAYNESGMALVWNFTTSGLVVSQTAVTPTTSGDYDWTHVGGGIYKIEMPASGGASANNDTEGFGWFSGTADGILPFTGPTYRFRAAALNDADTDGGDVRDVSVTEWAGTSVATPDTAGYPKVTVKDGTGAGEIDTNAGGVAHVVLVDTTTTNTDMRGTDGALLASSAPANFGDLSIAVTTGEVILTGAYDASKTAAQAGDAMTLTGAYDAAKTAAQAGDAMTLTGAYDAAKTAAQAGDAMTLTGAYDAAKTAAQAGDAMDLVDAPNATAVTALQSGLSTYDGSDTSGTTTLLGRLTATRSGYLDNLSAGAVAQESTLTSLHLNYLFADAYDPGSKPGDAAGLLNVLVESDGGVPRYTENALENAPGGTGGGSATIEKQDEILEAFADIKGEDWGAGETLHAIWQAMWQGAGQYEVDEDWCTAGSLGAYADDAHEIGVANVVVQVYEQGAYDAGGREQVASTYTGSDGGFGGRNLHLDAGSYVVTYGHAEYTFPNVEITVPCP